MSMLRTTLGGVSNASYVEYGFGQVEPNHLSAQRTGQIYAQLPAAQAITQLENGQFVKYDYANSEVNFTGLGEWMLVYNEIKLYRDNQLDCEFAMLKDNYNARIYSPVDSTIEYENSRNYAGQSTKGATDNDPEMWPNEAVAISDVVNYDEWRTITDNPFLIEKRVGPKYMKEGTTMVPRVFKTNIGDIFTTNTINADRETLAVSNPLYVGADGILTTAKVEASGNMVWQVVKVYTMPDGQKGVKVMRIA